MSNFREQTSKLMTVFIIGLVVMAFTFTGFESMKGAPDTIAKIGSTPIKLQEFQQEYTRLTKLYQQMFGGKSLSKAQIKNLKIKDAVFRNIAQKKIAINISKEIGIGYSSTEIKDAIKKLPYFLTNKQFDLRKYKAILRANSFTPTAFENTIKEDILLRKYQAVTIKTPISKTFKTFIKKFKTKSQTFNLIKIEKQKLSKFIIVNSSEISAYLKDEKNKNRVLSIFNERKQSFNIKEQVKARHILIKTPKGQDSAKFKKKIDKIAKNLTTKNFKTKANKYTEDPSGKKTGGNLGWFEKGKMVPEFEKVAFSLKPGQISKPVKTSFGYHIIYVEAHKKAKIALLVNHQNQLAKELILKSKTKELEQLFTNVKTKFANLLKENNFKKINKLNKKYNFAIQKEKLINLFDGLNGNISIKEKDFNNLFNSTKKFFDQKVNSGAVLISKSSNPKMSQITDRKKLDKDIEQLTNIISRKINQSFISEIIGTQKLKVFNNFRI